MRVYVVPDIRRIAETSPIRYAMYAIASFDGPDDARPRLHDDEWLLMKESGGRPWWNEAAWRNSWPNALRSRGFSGVGH